MTSGHIMRNSTRFWPSLTARLSMPCIALLACLASISAHAASPDDVRLMALARHQPSTPSSNLSSAHPTSVSFCEDVLHPDAVAGEKRILHVDETTMVLSNASDSEAKLACTALQGAVKFFVAHGFTPRKSVHLRFERRVDYVMEGENADRFRVVGQHDATRDATVMTKIDEPWLRERPYFGVEFTDSIYASVVLHEIVHSMSKQFYQYETEPSLKAQDEYVAYVAQLSSLTEEERARMFAAFKSRLSDFDSDEQINDWVCTMDPHGFGLLAYRHFLMPTHGVNFLRRVYSGNFRPPVMD